MYYIHIQIFFSIWFEIGIFMMEHFYKANVISNVVC